MISTESFSASINRACASDTSFYPKDWNERNPLHGHCGVVALLAQDYFGGKIMKISLKGIEGLEWMKSHFFNRLPDGKIIDFTIGQFEGKLPVGLSAKEEKREEILSYPGTRQRYELFKKRFDRAFN